MSLFGSSPDESGLSATPARSDQKSSLFDDEQPSQSKPGSSLFNDEANAGKSPWSMPTPKKASKRDPAKTLLSASDVPKSYINVFDILRDTEYKAESGKIKVSGAKRLFEDSGLDEAEQDRVLKLVTGGQDNPLGQSELNVLLALLGLAQEGEEESSLDSVDERRNRKPSPVGRTYHC